MHSKQKGNIASSAVIHHLNKLEYNVFHELGDYSKIDLIAEKNGKLTRIQVKYASLRPNNTVILMMRKCGPNGYCYRYNPEEIDYFAIYCPELDKVLFVKSSLACLNNSQFIIRIEPAKNNQNGRIHSLKDFLLLE